MLYATMLQYLALEYCLCLADEISYFGIALGSFAHSSFMDGQTTKQCNLYVDAMLVPIQMGTNMAARNRNIFQGRLQQKREIICRETKKKLK